jgi:hypothetical protein
MQRRGICFQRARLYSLCWRRIQRARGKKSVILALRYFSAAAGDALMAAGGGARLETAAQVDTATSPVKPDPNSPSWTNRYAKKLSVS